MIDEPTDLEEAFLLFKSEPTEANEDKMLEMIDHNRKLVKLLINVAKDVDNTYFKNQLKKLY